MDTKETVKGLREQLPWLKSRGYDGVALILAQAADQLESNSAEVERLTAERGDAHRIMGEFVHKTTMDTALALGVGQLKGRIDFLDYVIELHMAEYHKVLAEVVRP